MSSQSALDSVSPTSHLVSQRWDRRTGATPPMDISLFEEYIDLWRSADNPRPVSTEIRVFMGDVANMFKHLLWFKERSAQVVNPVSDFRIDGILSPDVH
jgi:hypothetical protein